MHVVPDHARATADVTEPVIARLVGVGLVRGGDTLLDDVTLDIDGHLVVMGPNGSGKTSLLRILSTYLHPTRGTVELFGNRYGQVDLRTLRDRVATVSSGMSGLLHRGATAGQLVGAARHRATRPVPLDDADRDAAGTALTDIGAGHLVDRVVGTLSQGEWQRVQIARALVTGPELLLLDEPFVGLDLPGREQLVRDLDRLLADHGGPTVVLVTHHLEEIPTGIGTAALLRAGMVVSHGPPREVLTSDAVSDAFAFDVTVSERDGRFHAVAR